MSSLKQFQQQVPRELYDRWEASGYTLDEVITAGIDALTPTVFTTPKPVNADDSDEDEDADDTEDDSDKDEEDDEPAPSRSARTTAKK